MPRTDENKRRRRKVAARVTLSIAGVVALAIAGAAIAAVVVMHSERGRARLVRLVEEQYAKQMQGSMHIGRIDRVEGLTADVSDIRFRDPRGNDVVRVERAHVRIEALPLLRGRLSLRDVSADGATVRLAKGHINKTSIQDAFAKEEGLPKRRMELDTHTMHVKRAEMIVAMGGPTIAVRGIHGVVRVMRFGDLPADVEMGPISGRITFPTIHVLRERDFRARGLLHAKRNPRIVMRVRGCFPRGEFPMFLRLSPGKLHLRFDSSDDHVMGNILTMVGHFSDAVDVERGSVAMRDLPPCAS